MSQTTATVSQTTAIGVVVDWKRGTRYNGWSALLEGLNNDNLYHNRLSVFALADLIVATPEESGTGFFVQDLDVLIINWDAANGDPEFGSDLALRWLGHRYPEILVWLRTGKLLIIEGQAVLSVPCQEAYDALAGKGELPVSGPEDPLNPLSETRRMGGRCRKTRHAPRTHGFENVDAVLKNYAPTGPTHEILFPGAVARLLTTHIKATTWHDVLYRGWFRRVFPGMQSLRWVSIFRTDGRGFMRNHSTMEVAKVGEVGAIFATTMFLASTHQRNLVLAMLNCAHKNTRHLPDPSSLIEWLRRGWKTMLTLSAGGIAGYVSGRYGPWVRESMDALGPKLAEVDPATLKTSIQIGFAAVGMALFEIARYVLVKLKTFVRDVVGY